MADPLWPPFHEPQHDDEHAFEDFDSYGDFYGGYDDDLLLDDVGGGSEEFFDDGDGDVPVPGLSVKIGDRAEAATANLNSRFEEAARDKKGSSSSRQASKEAEDKMREMEEPIKKEKPFKVCLPMVKSMHSCWQC